MHNNRLAIASTIIPPISAEIRAYNEIIARIIGMPQSLEL